MKLLALLISLTLPDAKPAQVLPVLYLAKLYVFAGILIAKSSFTEYKHRMQIEPSLTGPCLCGC